MAIVTRNAELPEFPDDVQAVINRLEINVVSTEGLKSVQGHMDRLFEKNEAAIVRPDRIVFGHTTQSLSLDELVLQLAEKLHLSV